MTRSHQLLRWRTLVLISLLLPRVGWARDLNVLFLGDHGHHQPRVRFEQLQPVMAARGITLTYTDRLQDVNADNLAQYDALVLYANIDAIDPPEAKALLAYVEQGHGFVPLHCASYCFRNSDAVVALMGAQFQRHGTGVFRTEQAAVDNPILQGFGGFESWDETYVHHLHNEKDRTVLSYRVDEEGREPWTWVRTQGQGRVFYTAWGHDERTWGNPGFQNLVERGIRWAAGDDPTLAGPYRAAQAFPLPQMNAPRTDVAAFEYIDVGAKIPNYVQSNQWGTLGEPFTKMQEPLAADESLKHLVLPRGFRAELFVADPDLGGKPICMTWDERGRLWVAETYDYPNELQPPGHGRDRIRICEDTDGDWRADKFTVFAESLSIPTSITFYRGGVIVQNGVETLYLKDTNGDDVADEKSVMFSGWNESDTHGGVSNFQYGLDNWVWAMQGYNYSEPRIKGQRQMGFRMGFWRFRPDGSQIEFLRSTDNNTWGFGMSEEGLVFGSTANHNPSVYMPIPNRYYEQVRGWTPSLTLGTIANTHLFKPITDKVRQVDQHGGYTAGAGHALYTARRYPPEYWNRTAFVAGPTGHLLGTFVLRPEGSDFHSVYSFNLAASDDEWSAPIMAEVGPDGNVWMIDWYNYIVQHNPTPAGFETGKGNAYETELRDKKHGRIYRIVYEAAGPATPISLQGGTPEQCVAMLKSDNLLWRRHAQRLIVERGATDVVPGLIELVQDQAVDALGLNTAAIHALWTLQGLSLLDGSRTDVWEAAVAALRHPSAGVRRNAVQVLPPGEATVQNIVAAELLYDPDAQVRLAAFLAMAAQPPTEQGAQAIAAALRSAQNLNDRWIPDAATAAAARHDEGVLRAMAGPDAVPPRLIEILGIVAEHYARGNPGNAAAPLLASFRDAHPSISQAIVHGLAAGWPADKPIVLQDATVAELEALLQKLEPAQRGQMVRLVSRWGSSQFQKYAAETMEQLLAQVDDTSRANEQRLAAARQLFEFQPGSEQAAADLLDRVTPQLDPDLAAGLIEALGQSDADGVGPLLTEAFASLAPSARSAAVAVFLQRKPWTEALLSAIDAGEIQLTELSLDQRQSLAAYPDRDIRGAARRLLERGGALPNADREKVLQSLLTITEQKGDPAAGKVVFTKICAKCHMHSGEGNKIGPDLTGMAVHPKHELLINILDPNRSVESNFRTYTLVTNQGLVLSGMLASESKTAIELFNAEGEKKTVLREDIEELIASTQSLMPEGFEKQASEIELRDLLEFMTQRGRYVPVDLTKAATISSDRGMFTDPANRVERLVFDQWGIQTFEGVPFNLIDPREGRVANVILLNSPNGPVARRMPRSVTVLAGGPAKAIHLLSGVSGWGFPGSGKGSESLIVRIQYADDETEEHRLLNGEHFADYIRVVDVPQSQLAFKLRGQQIRYFAIEPQRTESIKTIEFAKGSDRTAPVIMAVTLESL